MSSSAPIRWESLPLPVRLVMERLESKGFQIFLVGGCLRDLLRGENPQDYDLASTVPPEEMEQLDLFTDLATEDARREAKQAALAREKKLQEATLAIKKKFGKNAILKGMSLEEGATARERNARIGGHKA